MVDYTKENMRVDKILIRDFVEGDEIAVNNLFNSTFCRKRPMDEWHWKFKQNPAGESYIYLAEKNNKIIGHIGAIPLRVSIDGDIFVAYQYLDAMVESSSRKEGIFTNILSYSLSQAKVNEMLEIGFPKKIVYDIETAKLNIVHGLGEVDRYINYNLLSTNKGNYNPAFLKTSSIFKVDIFDERFDLFWEKVSREHRISLVKDGDYLNWRYIMKPQSFYSIFASQDKNEVNGFVVLKTVEKMGYKKGCIVDILSLKGAEIIQELLLYGLHYFDNQGVNLVTTYVKDSFVSKVLLQLGFVKVENEEITKKYNIEKMWLVVHNSNPRIKEEKLYNRENWRIIFGDSDWI